MAEAIGVSRVAVWKAIKTLVESGYAISAAPAGYRLERDRSDSVFPWEFSPDETGFKYFEETSSTMDTAREEALSGCADGLIVLSDRQTDGRGTGSRKWKSFDGALFFTMVTRPSVNPAYAHREILRAQLAMADAIESLSRARAVPQWPNDVYLPNGKACGILGETLSVGTTVSYLNLGIGVNTARNGTSHDGTSHDGTSHDGTSHDGTSHGSAPRPMVADANAGIAFVESGRQELLKAFRARFAETGKAGSDGFGTGDALVRAWNARCPLVGKTVRYRVEDSGDDERSGGTRAGDARVVEATFAGVDAAGWAIMQEGTERRYPPGSITILEKGTRS